jgi:hypothetical protein
VHRYGFRSDPAIFFSTCPWRRRNPGELDTMQFRCVRQVTGAIARLTETAKGALRRGTPRTLFPLWTGRQRRRNRVLGCRPDSTLDTEQVRRQVTLLDLPPHGS